MSLEELYTRSLSRKYDLVAIVQIGSTKYVKKLTLWDWDRNVRQIFPYGENGTTENLPLSVYEQWADEVKQS